MQNQTKEKRVGRTKSPGGFRNLSAAQKKFRKVDRKSPAILSTQSLRVPTPPATPPLIHVVVPFQFGEIASSLL